MSQLLKKRLRRAATVPSYGHYVAYAHPPGRVHRAVSPHYTLPSRPSEKLLNGVMRITASWSVKRPEWAGKCVLRGREKCPWNEHSAFSVSALSPGGWCY